MKANELRIGNILYFGDPKATIKPVYFHIEGGHSIQAVESGVDVKPVPLTEETLLKCGFEKHKNDYTKIYGNGYSFFITFYKQEFYLAEEHDAYGIQTMHEPIKYIHQLQNLYFALTGEELTINEL